MKMPGIYSCLEQCHCEAVSVTARKFSVTARKFSVTTRGMEGTGLRPEVEKLTVTSHQLLRMVSFGQVLTIATVLPIDELRLTNLGST
jgi:hypothetical protein